MMNTNPYRCFYSKQPEWHQSVDLVKIQAKHDARAKYYKWYTQDWLPGSRETKIVDIGCGSGSFLYFLKAEGYSNILGIDLSEGQVKLARDIGLNAKVVSAQRFLEDQKPSSISLISMIDVMEHLTSQELFLLMEAAYKVLTPGGFVIVSVPNATSPMGLSTRFSDITHETCFSPTTLSQMFFCHNMKTIAFRDPWPAPVSNLHKAWRAIAQVARTLETFRFKLLGLSAPKYWSAVIWAVAQKPS